MAKKRKTKAQRQQEQKLQNEIISIFLFIVLALTVLGEFGLTMIVGDVLVYIFTYLFGLLRFGLYGILGFSILKLFGQKLIFKLDAKFFGSILVIMVLGILLAIPQYVNMENITEAYEIFMERVQIGAPTSMFDAGGIIFLVAFVFAKQYLGLTGVILVGVLLLLLGLSLILGKTLYELVYPPLQMTKDGINSAKDSIQQSIQNKKEKPVFDVEEFYDDEIYDEEKIILEEEADEQEFYDYSTGFLAEAEEAVSVDAIDPTEDYYADYDIITAHEPTVEEEPILSEEHDNTVTYELDEEEEQVLGQPVTTIGTNTSSIAQSIPYQIPSIELLHKFNNKQSANTVDRSMQKRILQETLDNFGIKAQVAAVRVGPAVTQYEITLAPGVKVNKIVNLSTDISLALAAKGVRIEAPIPGKAAVGIEVPNESVQMVGLYEVLKKGYQNKSKKLLVGLGRTISGEEVQIELNKMPHLLVAGSTGSGKSVCINTLIVSVLLRATPDEVKFVMIDPKKVELNVYNDIPHLLSPVVTNPKKAAVALRKVVQIMDERYELFADAFVRNMEGYNEYARKNKLDELPYIVVIIDELSDLMVVAAKEVEESIMRLAQMARAAGIHMIVATQRPSVDVITGVIKSNIPSRIAFAVSSNMDSRTILDMGGAERLVGKGDMLYLPAGEGKPIRVQGAYVSEEEIEKIVDYAKQQQQTTYDASLLAVATATEESFESTHGADEDSDELFEDAVRFAISVEMISTSKLQRRFRIGFNRAARIMDEMVERGILGPTAGNKGRPVLIKDVSEIYTQNETTTTMTNE